MFNVKDYGAIGDGVTENAAAIQKAIDACHEAGGGEVVFPSGNVFLTGPFNFKSFVNIKVEANAVIKASLDESLYTESAFRENCSEGSIWIGGKNCKQIGINGSGVIDGQGTMFMLNEEKTHFNYKFENNIDMRPHLLTLEACQNITIRDVTFKDSAYWCIHPIGCKDIVISGVRILNSLKVRNCDGIDPDHCKNVRISDCFIVSADDCICPKTRREFEEYGITENITVTGCTLVSTSCAIKIGSENVSGIKNVIFSSIIIRNSNRALGIQNRDEGFVENIQFNDIFIDSRLFADVWWGKAEPIYVTAYKRDKESLRRFKKDKQFPQIGKVKDVFFNNVICDSENGVFVAAEELGLVQNIYFENIKIKIHKKSKYSPGTYDRRPCGVEGIISHKVSGFYLDKTEDVSINNCQVIWDTPSIDDVKMKIANYDNKQLVINNCYEIFKED